MALNTMMLGAAAFAQSTDIDPPGRVARLSEATGQVWLYSPDTGEWSSASRNRPLTTGDRLSTEGGARAELQIGSTTVRLDESSELEVARLDDDHVALALHEGSAIANVRDLNSAGQLEVATDAGRFVTLRAGTYRFDRANGKSDVTVYNGQARYEGPNSGLQVEAGRRAEFWIDSGGVAQYSLLGPVNDSFASWSSDRDRRIVASSGGSITERYVSPEIAGTADLDTYGRWEQNPDYGSVWIPTAVAADWAPYSHGHWAWVRPWGWTWVDDAPWGFAPFHYGRWVYARNNWCWSPGVRVVRPVYAPALVAWVGSPGASVSITVGGGPAVGWFPLAPREVYVPSYRVSPRYARNVNITNVTNVTVINNVFANPQGPRDFYNRRDPRAITVVPSNVMAERRPVAPAAAQFRQAPWVRDIASDRGRTAPMLAPPVAAPPTPVRIADPRDVRPPPGGRPDARDRPGFAGRPGAVPRDRNEAGREREPERRNSSVGREPDRPGVATGRNPPPQLPAIGLAPQTPPTAVPAPAGNLPAIGVGAPNPPSAQVEPGFRRPDAIPPPPGRSLRDREFATPAQGGTQRFQGSPAPVAPPTPGPVLQPARPSAVVPPLQQAPNMRTLPVYRGEDRRVPPPLNAPPSGFEQRQQQQQQQQQPPRFERPAPAAAPALARPFEPAPPPPRPVEVQRPAAPVVAPAAPPTFQPPPRQESQRPQRPEGRIDEPRRGDQRDSR